MCGIKVNDESATTATGEYVNCFKCGGSGVLSWAMHVDNGRCWACNATGRLKIGEAVGREGCYFFVVGDLVWHFNPIHHGDLDGDGGSAHYTARKGARVDSVLFTVFKSGADRRKGKTILRARVSTEEGREVWRRAQAGVNPDELAETYLAHLKGTCAMSRNFKGVECL